MSQTERIKHLAKSEKGEDSVQENDHVAWNWGQGMAEGHVLEVSEGKLTRETKEGVNITRNGEEGNPALYISNDHGNNVVKKQSEVYKIHDDDGDDA